MHTKAIQYNIACRECLQAEAKHMIMLRGEESLDHYDLKSDYEVVNALEKKGINLACPWCRSENIEILEVKINDELIYEYRKLINFCNANNKQLFELKYYLENGRIIKQKGGHDFLKSEFHKAAILKIKDTIFERDYFTFTPNRHKFFYISISGGTDPFTRITKTRVEKLNYYGFTREEILQLIEKYELELNT